MFNPSLIYIVPTVLYVILTVGWFIHVLVHKNEATRMHVLVGLPPLMSLISQGLTIGYGATLLVARVDSSLASAVFFLATALAASGYCYIPRGLPQGRAATIAVLSVCHVVFVLLSSFVSTYFGLVLFGLLIAEIVLLVRWSAEVTFVAESSEHQGQQQPHHHHHGMWHISAHHCTHVAKGVRRAVIAYVVIIFVGFIAGIILAIVLISWLTSPTATVSDSVIFAGVAVDILLSLLNALVMYLLMAPFRMDSEFAHQTVSAHAGDHTRLIQPVETPYVTAPANYAATPYPPMYAPQPVYSQATVSYPPTSPTQY